MRLNNSQRKRLANFLGDMASALIFGLVMVFTISESVTVLAAAVTFLCSLILIVASVCLLGTTESGNDQSDPPNLK